MTSWNAQKVRLWILEDLYKTWQESPQATTYYDENDAERSGFPLQALIAETKYLADKELVETLEEGAGVIPCFLSSKGRDFLEQRLAQAKAQQESGEIGFQI